MEFHGKYYMPPHGRPGLWLCNVFFELFYKNEMINAVLCSSVRCFIYNKLLNRYPSNLVAYWWLILETIGAISFLFPCQIMSSTLYEVQIGFYSQKTTVHTEIGA
jgi:hypothetical protein